VQLLEKEKAVLDQELRQITQQRRRESLAKNTVLTNNNVGRGGERLGARSFSATSNG